MTLKEIYKLGWQDASVDCSNKLEVPMKNWDESWTIQQKKVYDLGYEDYEERPLLTIGS